jgi:hypothetical protein
VASTRVANELRCAIAAAAAVVQLAVSTPCDAQAREARPEAVVIFDEAQTLMKAERFEEACAKFEEALTLSQGIGIQYNLALCYERLGRFASAWTHYLAVADATRRRGETDRQRVAEKRAAALAPRLTRLLIAPVDPPPDLEVSRSGAAVTRSQWNTAIPVDPGRYRIEARARGRVTWRREIVAEQAGSTVRVEVPQLAAAATTPAQRTTPPEPTPMPDDASARDEGLRIGGLVGVSLGAAGLVVGGVLGGLALAKRDAAFDTDDDGVAHCFDPLVCDEEGRRQIEEARSLSHGSTAAFVAGGVLAATGAVLLITLAADPAPAAFSVRVHLSALVLHGSF